MIDLNVANAAIALDLPARRDAITQSSSHRMPPSVNMRLPRVAADRIRQDKLREMLDIAVSTMIGSFQGEEHDTVETVKTNNLMGRLLGVDPAAHKAKVPITSALPIDGETLIEQLQLMSPRSPPPVARNYRSNCASRSPHPGGVGTRAKFRRNAHTQIFGRDRREPYSSRLADGTNRSCRLRRYQK